MADCTSGFRHTIDVRYGEVDLQGIVFNAHYLAYLDDAMETWLRPLRESAEARNWDMMLKRCTIEWDGSVGSGDRLDIDVAVSRWGGSSWDLDFAGSCRGCPVFRARVVYVSIERGSTRAIPTPQRVRDFLGGPVDLVGELGTG